ncbi:unnamed protein product, partial [Coregonus sp. 'balchen']
VNITVILGFGFLATFLVRYSFSGTGFTLLVAAMAVQWAVILLVVAEMCTAFSLIAIGAVLGKTNPVHLLLIALLRSQGLCSMTFLKPLMLFAFECHDTCGVLSVHGLPEILGWMVPLILQIADSDLT